MTARDRLVLIGIAALGVLAAVWLLVVAPEREQAASSPTEVSAAQAQLASAESQVSSARAAQAQYATAYASIVRLGKAVPAEPGSPSLIYQLAQASNQKNVDFASITTTVPGAGGAVEPGGEQPRGGRVRHGRRGLHADAVHVRLQRQLLRPLQPLPAARRLHAAHQLRSGCGSAAVC